MSNHVSDNDNCEGLLFWRTACEVRRTIDLCVHCDDTLVSAAEDSKSLGPKKSVAGASFNVFTGDFLGLPQEDVVNEMSDRCGLHCSLFTAGWRAILGGCAFHDNDDLPAERRILIRVQATRSHLILRSIVSAHRYPISLSSSHWAKRKVALRRCDARKTPLPFPSVVVVVACALHTDTRHVV